MLSKNIYSTLLIALLLLAASCKKFIEIPAPQNQLINPLPFNDDATATATVIGIYSEMMKGTQQFSSGFTTLYAAMAADELYYYTPSARDEFISNQITIASHSTLSDNFWQPAYKYIYAANLIGQQLEKSATLTPAVKNRLVAEAKFIRAFCYFYLTNLFGDVPLVLSTDYRITASMPRSSRSDIYKQIVSDLNEAALNLPENYPSVEPLRPNKWAATALLARVHLYLENWDLASTAASAVINSGKYSMVPDVKNVFLKNSPEAIWQLQPVLSGFNTTEGNAILPATAAAAPKYLLTNALMQVFEAGDARRSGWTIQKIVGTDTLYIPAKYKIYGNTPVVSEYYMVLRLAEQYLIRAEAKARLNDFTAIADINIIRNRAGLADTSPGTMEQLLQSIEQERRIELMAEWGHRWLDLKRTGRANEVLSVLKPATWQTHDQLWPVPNDQINLNPALSQNPGY